MPVQAWCLGWGWEAVESIHFESKDNRTSRWASCGVRERKTARPRPGTPEGAGRMESGGGGSHNSETSKRSPSLSEPRFLTCKMGGEASCKDILTWRVAERIT